MKRQKKQKNRKKRQKNRKVSAIEWLPEELLLYILKIVATDNSIEHVLQLRLVCVSWSSFIKDVEILRVISPVEIKLLKKFDPKGEH